MARDPHRIRLATAAQRDDLADYLRLGGWLVDAIGVRDLVARHEHAHVIGAELVSLRFSVAVWRAMNMSAGAALSGAD